ncbi:hypothetical protein [Microcoleus sp. FACHB-672]|uniref:hypothetical protein n=1 Tax=Microcoleus sp. FACHB-672 TaxID=2692825 RepID=UPI001684C0E2|nr:hypothetical protein [Microcoleus sp. FACHB-672]MBD2041764.1 hypothetical protein [Microcoleus sp. FACHB-672]
MKFGILAITVLCLTIGLSAVKEADSRVPAGDGSNAIEIKAPVTGKHQDVRPPNSCVLVCR